MKLAVNYSPQALSLLSQQHMGVDRLKCPPWPELIAQAQASCPAYVHFGLDAGCGSLADTAWGMVERLLLETDTPYINVHLQARTEKFAAIPADSRQPSHLQAVAESFIKDVELLAQRFGPERVIVENVIYLGPEGKFLYAAVDPAVITAVFEETKCGLLLDTAHAQMTCRYFCADPREYISRLPVHQLHELHVTGLQEDGQRLRDSMPMGAEGWALAEWVLGQVRQA